jgi:hypothetical protein
VGLVLDSGALIGFQRGDRAVASLIEASRRRREQVVTSSGCVAQVWRRGGPGQALLVRLLAGLDEKGLDRGVSRQLGELCAKASSNDAIDAHVALLARDHDVVLTSDVKDLRHLLQSKNSSAQVRGC